MTDTLTTVPENSGICTLPRIAMRKCKTRNPDGSWAFHWHRVVDTRHWFTLSRGGRRYYVCNRRPASP